MNIGSQFEFENIKDITQTVYQQEKSSTLPQRHRGRIFVLSCSQMESCSIITDLHTFAGHCIVTPRVSLSI